jgi:hypothetical protein
MTGFSNWSNQMQSQGGIFGGSSSSGGGGGGSVIGGGGGAKLPKAPKIKKLTYKQLLARSKNDALLRRLLPFIQGGIDDEKSLYTERTGRNKEDRDLTLGDLNRSQGRDKRDLEERMAAQGALRSGAYAIRGDELNQDYTTQRSKVNQDYEGVIAELLAARNANIKQYQLQRTQAKDDAIQRLLAKRTNLRMK